MKLKELIIKSEAKGERAIASELMCEAHHNKIQVIRNMAIHSS